MSLTPGDIVEMSVGSVGSNNDRHEAAVGFLKAAAAANPHVVFSAIREEFEEHFGAGFTLAYKSKYSTRLAQLCSRERNRATPQQQQQQQ